MINLRKEYIFLIITAFIWGTGHPIGKLILREIFPLQLAMLSSSLGSLALLLTLIFSKRMDRASGLRGRELFLSLALGAIMFFLYPILSFSALERIPASVNGILVATSTIFVALASAVFLEEKLTLRNYMGLIVAFVGVSFVVLGSGEGFGDGFSLDLFGCLLSLSGAVSAAAYAVIGKKLMEKQDPLVVTLISSTSGTVFLLLAVTGSVGFKEIMQTSSVVISMVVYWGVFSGIAYFLFYYSLRRLEATRVSSFIYLSPLFAVLLSVLILGEEMTVLLIVGMVLIFLGLRATQESGEPSQRRGLDE